MLSHNACLLEGELFWVQLDKVWVAIKNSKHQLRIAKKAPTWHLAFADELHFLTGYIGKSEMQAFDSVHL